MLIALVNAFNTVVRFATYTATMAHEKGPAKNDPVGRSAVLAALLLHSAETGRRLSGDKGMPVENRK